MMSSLLDDPVVISLNEYLDPEIDACVSIDMGAIITFKSVNIPSRPSFFKDKIESFIDSTTSDLGKLDDKIGAVDKKF